MRHKIPALCLAASILTSGEIAHAIPVARLQLQSEPGNQILNGGSVDVVYDDSLQIIYTWVYNDLPSGEPTQISILFFTPPPEGTADWLWFGTGELGIPIQPGVYSDAQRATSAEPGHPGLDVSYHNLGSNTLTGEFTIFEATFTPDQHTILSFVAEFEQHSDGNPAALFGQFEYRAAGIVPEPDSGLLTLVGLVILGRLRRLTLRS